MCDAGLIIGGAGLAIGVLGDITKYHAQKEQAKRVVESARSNEHEQTGQLSLRATQEMDSANQSIMSADRQARIADAQARVSAGEAGVAGSSVDALLGDITRQDLEFKQATKQNLGNTLDQITAEKSAVRATAQSQINSAPFPSAFAAGLNIAGRVLDFGSQVTNRLPRPGK